MDCKDSLENASSAVPWREVFPEYVDEDMPGICLSAARDREKMTQEELSCLTGISVVHLSEMETGERILEESTARKLAKALHVDYRVFMNDENLKDPEETFKEQDRRDRLGGRAEL